MEKLMKKIDKIIIGLLALISISFMVNIAEILLYEPMHTKILNVSVVDEKDIIIADNVSIDNPVQLKVYQSLVVKFLITRNYTGHNNIERVFEISETAQEAKSEYVINHNRRPVEPSSSIVIAKYDIPNFIKPGCNYNVYSRNSLEYKYNLLQKFVGTVIISPKIKICVID